MKEIQTKRFIKIYVFDKQQWKNIENTLSISKVTKNKKKKKQNFVLRLCGMQNF